MHLPSRLSSFFFFNDTATTEIYTLSLHDALPIFGVYIAWRGRDLTVPGLSLLTFWSRKSAGQIVASQNGCLARSEEHTSELQSHSDLVCRLLLEKKKRHRLTEKLSKDYWCRV